MGVRPTHFQIETIIIILGLPSESHHRTSSSPLLRTFLLLSTIIDVFCVCYCAALVTYSINNNNNRNVVNKCDDEVYDCCHIAKVPRIWAE